MPIVNTTVPRVQYIRQKARGWSVYPISHFGLFELAWQRLNAQSGNSPLLEPAFVIPLIDYFARGDEVLAVHRVGEDVDAMGIFSHRGKGVWDTFQPAQAPLGLWLHRTDVPIESLLPTLRRCMPGMVLSLGIEQVDPDIYPRPDDSRFVRTLDHIRTCRILVHGEFDDYWSTCSKNLRRNVSRQFNKLRRLGISPCLDVLTEEIDIAGAIREYGRLESNGWKAVLGTAVHADNIQGRFYQAVLESFCARGRAAVFQYRFDDAVVAMDLCIERDGVLVNLKSAYDERITSLSPAFLLLHAYVRRTFAEARIKRIEFYGPEMEWNRQWCGEARRMYHVNHYRWPWLPSIKNHPAVRQLRRMTGAAAIAAALSDGSYEIAGLGLMT